MSACGEPVQRANDPAGTAIAAGAMVAQATQIAQATQQAQAERARQATIQAAATEQASRAEIDRLNKEIAATQAAVSVYQTMSAAQYFSQQATEQAIVNAAGTATAGPQTAVAIVATQTAVYWEIRDREQRYKREQTRDTVFLGILLVFSCVMAIIVGWGSATFIRSFIEWQDRKKSIWETSRGVAVFGFLPDGTWGVQLLAPPGRGWGGGNGRPGVIDHGQPRLPAQAHSEVVELTPSVFASEPAKPKPAPNKIAVDLLFAVKEMFDEDENKIHGWRDLDGWNSEKWQRAVSALAADPRCQITSAPGAGTRTNIDGGVDRLLQMLLSRQIVLSPAPEIDAE